MASLVRQISKRAAVNGLRAVPRRNIHVAASKQVVSRCAAPKASFVLSQQVVKRFASTEIKCPGLGDSVLEGDVIEWKKAVGDYVEVDEVICVLETAKVTVDIPSPVAGVLTAHKFNAGETVHVDDLLAIVDPDAPKPAGKPAAPKAEAPKAAAPAAAAPKAPAAPAAAAAAAPVAAPVTGGFVREERRVKMSRMRQTIAKRLKDAQNGLAMLTTFNEIDMSGAKKLRDTYKDDFLKKHNVKLGYMSIFSKAAAAALEAYPEVNAYIDTTTNEVVYRNFVDISVAVATPTGLVVPVVRNVQDLSFAGVEGTIKNYGEKARNGTIAMEDFVGGTFTISNGGVYGSLMGTPIINPPQSAILGMHGIFDRPVAVKGQVEIRPMMYVALTYDHRLIDGSSAVSFLKHIKNCVEDPQRLLLDL